MAEPTSPDLVDLLAKTMGAPCPFPEGDLRRELWMAAALAAREAEARMQATLLAKIPGASESDLLSMLVEAQVSRFDTAKGLAILAVGDFESAAAFEAELAEGRSYLLQWFAELLRGKPGWIRNAGLLPRLKLRLDQRVAHWTAEALAAARREERAKDEAIVAGTRPPPADSAVPLSMRRAAWLQAQLDSRGWTVHDLERFNGPNWRTTRKVLSGRPVRVSVLERLVQALSGKGRVSLADIPED